MRGQGETNDVRKIIFSRLIYFYRTHIWGYSRKFKAWPQHDSYYFLSKKVYLYFLSQRNFCASVGMANSEL